MSGRRHANILSASISLLRFPLIVGVVLIHCNLLPSLGDDITGRGHCVWGIELIRLVSTVLARSCVPLFFMIAGYLYFRGRSEYGLKQWKRQSRRRLRSLLLPYLLWNLLGLCAFMVKRSLGAVSGFSRYAEASFGWTDIIAGFWAMPGTEYPYDFVLWFIRDLMVVAFLLTPVVWAAVRKGGLWLFAVLTLVMLAGFSYFALADAFFFFYAGAYVAIKDVDVVRLLMRMRGVGVLWIASASAVMMLTGSDSPWFGTLYFLTYTLGTLAISRLAVVAVGRGHRANRWLENSSFFLYACHGLYCTVAMRLVIAIISPSGSLTCLAAYIADAALLITFTLLLYLAAGRLFPRLTAILTGGRAAGSNH